MVVGGHWASSGDLIRSWRFRTGLQTDRISILNAVWDKEMGHMSKYWKLKGVRKGVLYVASQSPAASTELQVRGREIIRSLNKYFKTAWIKGIKTQA